VALLSRDPPPARSGGRRGASHYGVRALPIPTDVADADAVEAAAERAEAELGPIDVWVNVAMATVFAPVEKLTAAEVERGTRVTYLGQVHGMMSALKRMRVRNRGTIVNVGSALAYRSVPLQSIYCGAKAAIRGFTDSLRSEIIHDKLDIQLTIVDLPAINTPQFDWALNKMGRKAKPVAPIFQPEVPARAIFLCRHPQAARRMGGLAHGKGDPREPRRAGADRPLSRQGRLFRSAHGQADRARRARQPVRAGAGRLFRARPLRRSGARPKLRDVHRPAQGGVPRRWRSVGLAALAHQLAKRLDI
jgi:NAD(P)-dependent dehydrogenase (short-subunit alcohol dehydrogenase family)